MVNGLQAIIDNVYRNHPSVRGDAALDAAVDALVMTAPNKVTTKARLRVLRADVTAKRSDQGRRLAIAALDPLT